jgi:hypothetical protein
VAGAAAALGLWGALWVSRSAHETGLARDGASVIVHARADAAGSVEGFVAEHCIRCHEGERPKGRFSLEASRRHGSWLADVLARVDARDMPPDGEPRPHESEYVQAASAIRLAMGDAAPSTLDVPVRRLSREELRRAVRDIFGVDEPSIDAIPADDIGNGFDNSADVQRAPALWLERVVEAAERIAAQAVRDPADREPRTWSLGADDLVLKGTNGARRGGALVLYSSGAAVGRIDTGAEGRARIVATVSGQQAGPQHVRIDIVAGGRRAGSFDVPQRPDAPGQFVCEVPMRPGRHAIEVRFTNDYLDRDAPEGDRDRNCCVHAVDVTFPIDAPPPTPFESWLARNAGPSTEDRIAALLSRAWRIDADEARIEARRVVAAMPDGDDPMRFAVMATIASPRFLYAESVADRLALFLWSSFPDDELMRASRAGELATERGLSAQVTRMLADPRASAISERFAVQWLQVGRLADARPDPARFEGVDRALLDSMATETVLYVDSILRERRRIDELLESDFGFMDERLARHYGVAGVWGAGMRRVPLPDRGGGVLRQASVLTATSHPTATSPVKRGKWVMEVLLDAPPPPAPPGVPPLSASAGGGAMPMREALAIHRADPNCASCHVVMDAIGLAFESRDATGRVRAAEGGDPIDDSTVLPDGTRIAGVDGVAAWVQADPRFARALVRHMAVYALGRGLRPEDGAAIDAAVESLRHEPTLWHAVHRVAQLLRGAA